MQSLSNSNEKLEEKLETLGNTLSKIEEFTTYSNEVSAKLAETQATIQSTLVRVNSNVYKLQVENEKIQDYFANALPPELGRMYNEARTGK